MNKPLHHIKQKMEDVENALLRFEQGEEKVTMHVRVEVEGDNPFCCVLTNEAPAQQLINKKVNIIQKRGDDYLYIAGTVSDEAQTSNKIIPINIEQACWFVRRVTGKVSWLQEKYLYETA